MGTKESLLAQIVANPDDDAPRLVFADWCEENGEPDRAEFIRLQMRLEAVPERDAERFDLEERAGDLLAAHREGWLEGLPAWARREAVGFRRGLPGEVRLTPGRLLSHGEKLTRVMPLVRLTLDGLGARAADVAKSAAMDRLAELDLGVPEDPEQVGEFFRHFRGERLRRLGLRRAAGVLSIAGAAAWPGLARLTDLSVREAVPPDDDLAALLASPQLGGLRRLELPSTYVGPRAWAALAKNERLAGVRHLDLSCAFPNWEGLTARLAELPWELDSLKFTRWGVGEEAVRLLARAPWFAGLRNLEIDGHEVAEALPAAMAGAPACRLESLSIGGARSHVRFPALFASDLAAGLTSLDLGGQVAPEAVSELARSAVCPRLARLGLGLTNEPSDAVCQLIGSPDLPALRELAVTGGPLTPTAARRLPRLPGLSRLRSLALRCGLDDEAVSALARSPLPKDLRRLDLHGNAYADAGVRALLEAPWLPSLRELRLINRRITWSAIRALAGCAALSNLRVLELHQASVGERAAEALAESPHLGRLLRLRLCESKPLRAAVDRLRERFGGLLELD
jgi:uncharacterized protein (TIGR02996 family)